MLINKNIIKILKANITYNSQWKGCFNTACPSLSRQQCSSWGAETRDKHSNLLYPFVRFEVSFVRYPDLKESLGLTVWDIDVSGRVRPRFEVSNHVILIQLLSPFIIFKVTFIRFPDLQSNWKRLNYLLFEKKNLWTISRSLENHMSHPPFIFAIRNPRLQRDTAASDGS